MILRRLAFAFVASSLSSGCQADVASIGEQREETDASVPREAEAQTTGRYLEAEDGTLSSDGFTIVEDATASAGRYIQSPDGVKSLDAPGAALAEYSVTLEKAGSYLVWGRIHSPDASHNTLWTRIDDGTWYLWRISTGDVFFWNPFHDGLRYGTPLVYELGAGEHRLTIAGSVENVALDRLYFTADSDEPAGNETLCNPPNSIELGGVCAPSCGAQGGNGCGAECVGLPVIRAYDCDVCCVVSPSP